MEVYPSLWVRRFPKDDRDGDEQAAYAVDDFTQLEFIPQLITDGKQAANEAPTTSLHKLLMPSHSHVLRRYHLDLSVLCSF